MKGVLLVDDRDSVIFTNGDNEFLLYIRNYDEIKETSEIESPLSDESGLSNDNILNQFITVDIPNRQATDVFLPLIMLYNSHRAQRNIIINEIESNNLKFFFRHLSEQHYIIYVTEVDYKCDSKRILDKLHHLFGFYIGPFGMLIRNELSSMRHAKNMLKYRVNEVIEKKKPLFQEHLDHPNYSDNGLKFCKNLSNGLKLQIPNNLCILIRNGTLLASSGTKNSFFTCNHLTDSLSGNDIEELMHIRDIRLKFKIDEEFDSIWLKIKKKKDLLLFVNVFFIKLTNEISCIIITSLNDSWKIYKINEIFEHMYNLGKTNIIKNCLNLINQNIYDLFPKNKIDYNSNDILLYKNHGRRIINIWSKLEKQLLNDVGKKDEMDKKNYQDIKFLRNNFNNTSCDSGVEVKSVTTSILNAYNKSKKILKSYFDDSQIHLELLEEVMIAQLKRMFRLYLNDLLEINKDEGRLYILNKIKTELKYWFANERKLFFKINYEEIKISVNENSLGYILSCSNLPFRYCHLFNNSKEMLLKTTKIELLLLEYLNVINFNDVDDKEECIEISGLQNNSVYYIKYSVRDNYIDNLSVGNSFYPRLCKYIFNSKHSTESTNVFQIYAIFDFSIDKEIAIIQCKEILKYYYHYISCISKNILV
ncbi:Hypothetical protein SRAE_X000193000 [Strongyloides ratti]|uniref:Uncharacterized protein n=1 Tax=Strongyloides ratti TaxID=34506 RepID=A0A090KS46_STRRB|nr:Hypothetical protein SRAE_X000193000 [Strongyloides ratti]CEF60190.1 Hypothetical protein SRAE_X000193000 [Strongyloides ratti]